MKLFLQSVAALVLGLVVTTGVRADVQSIYNESCATCHAAGMLGAPKANDAKVWSPRLKQGMPVLVERTKNGYKNMPAGGLCSSCSDADFKALIELMSK